MVRGEGGRNEHLLNIGQFCESLVGTFICKFKVLIQCVEVFSKNEIISLQGAQSAWLWWGCEFWSSINDFKLNFKFTIFSFKLEDMFGQFCVCLFEVERWLMISVPFNKFWTRHSNVSVRFLFFGGRIYVFDCGLIYGSSLGALPL